MAIDAKRKQIDAKTTEIVKQQQWLASAEAALAMTKLPSNRRSLSVARCYLPRCPRRAKHGALT